MILATKLVYDFQRKYNQSNRGSRKTIPLVDVIGYINEAQGVWYSQLADAYETNSYASGELRQYEEKDVSLVFVEKTDIFHIYALPENMYKRLNQKALVQDVACCGTLEKTLTIRIETSDKINEILKNPLFAPDFKWEQLPGNEAGHSFYVYHGDMDVKKLTIDYLRFPNEIHAPSLIAGMCSPQEYEDYAGRKITKDINFEPTSRFSDRKVVDIAVLLAKGDREDYNAFQKQIQAIVFGENQLKQN